MKIQSQVVWAQSLGRVRRERLEVGHRGGRGGDRVVEREWEAESGSEKEEDEQEVWAYVRGGRGQEHRERGAKGRQGL